MEVTAAMEVLDGGDGGSGRRRMEV